MKRPDIFFLWGIILLVVGILLFVKTYSEFVGTDMYSLVIIIPVLFLSAGLGCIAVSIPYFTGGK